MNNGRMNITNNIWRYKYKIFTILCILFADDQDYENIYNKGHLAPCHATMH
jgi:hypothetical protein